MATQNLVQRSLRSLNQTVTAFRTGEGDGAAARLGRSTRRGIERAKAGLKNLGGASVGSSSVDAYEDDVDDQRRRRKARSLIGDDAPMVFVAKDGAETRDLNATVAPEFRAQVAAGLAAANTMTAGSTLVDAGVDGGEPDGF